MKKLFLLIAFLFIASTANAQRYLQSGTDSVTCDAGTDLDTSALALDTSVDGVEALLATIDADTSIIQSDTTAILADTGTISTNSTTIAAGYTTEGSALGSGVLLQGDDGTDRKNINVDATTGDVQVDVTNTVTVDGSAVTQPVSGTVTCNAGTNLNTSTLALDASVDGVEALLTTIDADTGGILADTAAIQTAVEIIDNVVSGSEAQVDVVGALPTGTNTIGNVGLAPQTSGGLTIYRNLDTNTGANIKASAGQLFGWAISNLGANNACIKLFNSASAPTLGSGTPVITFCIPPYGAANHEFTNGVAFSAGIGITAAVEATDAGTTDPGTNIVIANIFYK